MHALDWVKAENTAKNALSGWDMHNPGGVIIGFDKAGFKFTCAAGVASLASKSALEATHILRFASVTKHVFASFVLAHPDVISLDDRLGQHLPKLKPALAAVTVGRALDMSGGIPDTRECLTLTGHSIFSETRQADLLAFHEEMDALNYKTGHEIHYSNGGYRLVEEAMRAHGLLFSDYVKEICAGEYGLDMHAPEMWTDPVEGLQPGYWFDGEDGHDQGWQLGLQGMHLSSAGSLAGSPEALANWGRLLLGATLENGAKAPADLLSQLSAPRPMANGAISEYGLGMCAVHVGNRALVGHGGSQPGYKSYILLDPETDSGVIICANRDDANSAGMAKQVMAALLGQELPVAACDLRDGWYVDASGQDWLRIDGASCDFLDDATELFDLGEGAFGNLSSTGPRELRAQEEEIIGHIGHDPRRFKPVTPELLTTSELDGVWENRFSGFQVAIDGNIVVTGSGPTRRYWPLTKLSAELFVFDYIDGPWKRRITVQKNSADQMVLKLSRARMISFEKIS